jgi:hypothetical protein
MPTLPSNLSDGREIRMPQVPSHPPSTGLLSVASVTVTPRSAVYSSETLHLSNELHGITSKERSNIH